MSLFLSLLPIYLFGNVHCLGMCGPLVALIGHHRFRYWYFLGRLLAFSAAAGTAGLLGSVLHVVLNRYHIGATVSLLFGGLIWVVSLSLLLGWQLPGGGIWSRMLSPLQRGVSMLMLKDRRWPTFLFGLATVLLPCGQTLIVYSAAAVAGDPLVGLANGAALAIFTSPSLALAMHASRLLSGWRAHYNLVVGWAGLLVGTLALCRGLADLQLIDHWILNPAAPAHYHIVLY